MLKWLDRYDILDAEHIPGLETTAAIHEFSNKMPRDQAESCAYADYVKERLIECAAHHLSGMRAAIATKDEKVAKRHGMLYHACLRELGYPDVGPVPKDIENKIKHETPKVYNFRGHDADIYVNKLNKSESDLCQELFGIEDPYRALAKLLVQKALG